jgi:hypothetical protein
VTPHDRWKQIVAGLDAIQWSHLAAWNSGTSRLQPLSKTDFDAHWPTINPRSGRWLCWIAFCVGTESILKGAFGLKGHKMSTLGACHPWESRLNIPASDLAFVAGSICQLAGIRNRDAHEFVHNVRDADFPFVESHFVPSLNIVLGKLSQADLTSKYPGPDADSF